MQFDHIHDILPYIHITKYINVNHYIKWGSDKQCMQIFANIYLYLSFGNINT